MPACSLDREVVGSTVTWRICGKFEGACAWELSSRIQTEPLGELTLDFSQCGDFVDYGIAVLANAILSLPEKCIHLEGLRQHQLRLFKYFGVDADALLHGAHHHAPVVDDFAELRSEVA